MTTPPLHAVSSEVPEPVMLSPEQYWEMRARLLDHQQLAQQHELVLKQSAERLNALLTAAGLDPAQRYRLNDADLSAIRET